MWSSSSLTYVEASISNDVDGEVVDVQEDLWLVFFWVDHHRGVVLEKRWLT